MKNIWWIILAVLVVGLIVWAWLDARAFSRAFNLPPDVIGGGDDQELDCFLVIKEGSTGPEVAAFQQWYNETAEGLLNPIVVDGIFGPRTLRALQLTFGPSKTQTTLDEIGGGLCIP